MFVACPSWRRTHSQATRRFRIVLEPIPLSLEGIRHLIRGFDLVRRLPVLQKAGTMMPVHIDIKGAFGDPERLRILAAGLNALLPPATTCVAACGYGGIPLAVTIALQRSCHLTLVRETPKPYGAGAIIEAYLPTEADTVALIDDKIVSGSTIANAIAALIGTRAAIIGTYVVVDTRTERTDPYVHCLFSIDTLSV